MQGDIQRVVQGWSRWRELGRGAGEVLDVCTAVEGGWVGPAASGNWERNGGYQGSLPTGQRPWQVHEVHEWVEEPNRKFGQQVEFAFGTLLGPSGVEGRGDGGEWGRGTLEQAFCQGPTSGRRWDTCPCLHAVFPPEIPVHLVPLG